MRRRMPRMRLLRALPLLMLALSAPTLPDQAGIDAAWPTFPVSQPSCGEGPGDLETALLQAAPTLRLDALGAALSAWDGLHAQGKVARPLLTVIDYGLPSTAKRLW